MHPSHTQFCSEGGGSMFLQSTGIHVSEYMMLQSVGPLSEKSVLLKSEMYIGYLILLGARTAELV